MEHVAKIQEIVDENKQHMPTGAVRGIMESCQDAYHSIPKLYKIQLVRVFIQYGELVHSNETILVESCTAAEWADLAVTRDFFRRIVNEGRAPESALGWPLPCVYSCIYGSKVLENVIIVSISPHNKRSRE